MTGPGNSKDRLTYAGGFDAVLRQMEGRRDPMTFAEGESLPDADIDLAPLRSRRIGPVSPELKKSRSTFAYKCRELHEEFAGHPEICYLNGLLIANLRRRGQPDQTAPLFRRLWAEEHDILLARLDARWLVSSVTTFADHGATPVQRSVGHAMSVLFGTMKLYETERLFSGHAPDQPFPWRRKSAKALPLQMDAYAVTGGGLDVNMLGRLWMEAAEDPVIAPLAHHLLEALNADPLNVFRRLRLMREARDGTPVDPAPEPVPMPATEPAPAPALPPTPAVELFTPVPRYRAHAIPVPPGAAGGRDWAVAATVRAPLREIARFAAWHLELGAARVHLYLDDAQSAQAAWLARHPKLQVTACDDAYWATKPRRPKTHQVRQTVNVADAYGRCAQAWLAHLDVDEFLLPVVPLERILAEVPGDAAAVQVPPAEMLATGGPGDTRHFKLTARLGGQRKRVLEEIYPTFGAHLRGGYVSHLEGKLVVRTGLEGAEPGIHTLMWTGRAATNRVILRGSFLGHAHAPSYAEFRDKLAFRMDHGSYRKTDDASFRLADVIGFLRDSEGEAGLRQFYDEVCTGTPRLMHALARRNMLLTREMPLDRLVQAHFGAPPPEDD